MTRKDSWLNHGLFEHPVSLRVQYVLPYE